MLLLGWTSSDWHLQARSIYQLAPKGNYVLIAGSPSDINAKILHDAQLRVLKPAVDRGEIKIVADVWARIGIRRKLMRLWGRQFKPPRERSRP